jgi:catechol 2,3-dioxygenase-like lactoylglutathione lyase family enzyme
MIDHVSIVVDEIDVAETFYDAVMQALGQPKVGREAKWIGYGLRCDADSLERSYLSIRQGAAPNESFGRHWCFKAPDRQAVDLFWQAGIQNGGKDDGKPDVRLEYHPHYYAAFLVDPSGNRIEAVCHMRQ